MTTASAKEDGNQIWRVKQQIEEEKKKELQLISTRSVSIL